MILCVYASICSVCVLMFVCVYTHVHMGAYTHMCFYLWKQEIDLVCPSLSFATLFFQTGSLTELNAH